MAHTQALYYPWIDIRNDGWMKTSALFWEKIQTIVPGSLNHPYEEATSKEFQDAGILIPLRVESEMDEIEALTDDVIRYLSSDEAANLLLSTDRRRHTYIHPEKLPNSIRRLARIHPEKLAHQIRFMMEESGLGRQRSGWLEVDGEFASFYMTLLATRLADRFGLGLLTDSSAAERLSSKARADSEISSVYRSTWDEDYEFRARRRRRSAPRELAEGMMVDLIIEHIGICSETPIYKILEFREKHKQEVGKFRKKIEELTSNSPENACMESLRQFVHDKYHNEVSPAISDLKEALNQSRIGWAAKSLMKVSFLSVGTSSALVGSGLTVPNALLVGAGISLVGMGILYNEDRKNTLRSNPFSYVVSVEKALA